MSDDVIDAAVCFVAAQPGGPARILSTHYRLEDGHCAGCTTASTRWPCTAAEIAVNAARAQRRHRADETRGPDPP